MNAVFADAGYWIALFNPRDQLHTKAITVSNTLQGCPIVTSQMVLTEFLNHYAALGQPNSVRLNFCMAVGLSDASGQYGRSIQLPWPSH
jgi:hypothetical protein